MNERIASGTTVSWESQSWGVTKKKTGSVVVFVPAGQDPREIWPEASQVKKSHIKFDMRPSRNDRYIVAVPRPNSRTGVVNYYAPVAKWLQQ